jgi:hypothetical protein
MTQMQSFQMNAEMKEFASFSSAGQRYIRRSLDVARPGSTPRDGAWVHAPWALAISGA